MDTVQAAAPLRALYAADDSLNADMACWLLRNAVPPIELDIVHSALEVRLRLQREPGRYAWILFDLGLPGGDGLQVLEDVRLRRLPLAAVAVAGAGDEHAVTQALKAGVDDCLVRHGDYLQQLPRMLHEAREHYQRTMARLEQPLRVLYVEDGIEDSERMARHLAAHAWQVQLQRGQASMPGLDERLAAGAFDVLLLDCRLDDLNTFQWLRRVQACRHRGLAVVIAGRDPEDVVAQALHLGVPDCVLKEAGYLQRLSSVLEFAHARARSMQEREYLRRSEWGLRHLMQQVPGAILVLRWTATGPIGVAQGGEALARLLGFDASASTFAGKAFGECVHPDDRGRLEQVLGQAAHELAVTRCEFRLRDAGSTWRWIEMHVRPEREEGGSVLLYSYAFDASERRRQVEMALADEAAQCIRSAKAEFLSRVSHELRTPLNAVLGFAQLMQADPDHPVSETQRHRLKLIEQAGVHLAEMIGGALDPVCRPLVIATPLAAGYVGPVQASRPAHSGAAAEAVRSVLYAEDDEVNVEIVCGIIAARTRLKLEVARSGAEAIRMARHQPPDLLLLDIHLGDMDGIAVSDALREDPRLRGVPRVALSADASPGQVQRAREQGFADYLTKPVDVATLTACLERHLSRPGCNVCATTQ